MINAVGLAKIKEVELEVVEVLDQFRETPMKLNLEKCCSIYSTTRKFDLSLPTSLLLLNKTLINIEGWAANLSRIDLWTTAKPFIQSWVAKNIERQCLKI